MSVLRSLFFITLLALWTGGPARAASWQDAIDEVRTKEKKYHEMATTIGWPVHAGTMYNELDIPQHSCAILGRMLGKMNLIKHLEKVYPTTSVDGEEFRLAAISLGNWAHTAEFLLKMDKSRRIKSWNLDCVGRMGIPASAYISDYGAATFFDVDEQTLRILGDVESGFSNKLFSAIKENPKIKYVALGSGGGSVLEALTAGRIIRKLRLETTLWNNCYSACSLVFLGGVERTIWSPYPDLGFHMVSRNGIAEPFNSDVYVEIARYAHEMGVDRHAVINAMLAASPNEMHYLESEIMCKAAIATWIQRDCSYD